MPRRSTPTASRRASNGERQGNATRAVLLDTAEREFGAHGIDAVSLNEIVQLAGVNTAAIHYHFRSKEGLVEAIVQRGIASWAGRRAAMLTDLERRARPSLRAVVEAMVLPTTMLWETSGGRQYVQFLGAVAAHPVFSQVLLRATDEHTSRMLAVLERATPSLPAAVRVRRYAFAREFVHHALMIDAGPVRLWMQQHQHGPQRPLDVELVDFLTGAMGAPVRGGLSHQPLA